MALREKSKNSSGNSQQQMIIIGLVAAAVIVAVAAIIISNTGLGGTAIDYSAIPQGRTEDGAFILGDPNAPVTVVAFEDFLCPHCQDYQGTIKKFIQEQVATGKARFEYRFLPAIDPTYSYLMANLAECSEILRPNSFWEAHDKLFEINSRVRFGTGTAKAFSDAMGLNYSQVLDCTTKDAGQIDVDRKLGDELGVTGTPTVFIRYGDAAPVLQSPPPTADQLAAIVSVGAMQQP